MLSKQYFVHQYARSPFSVPGGTQGVIITCCCHHLLLPSPAHISRLKETSDTAAGLVKFAACARSQVKAAFSLAVSPAAVAVACAGGIVRLFAPRTLVFKSNLPRPAARGQDLNASIAGPTALVGAGAWVLVWWCFIVLTPVLQNLAFVRKQPGLTSRG